MAAIRFQHVIWPLAALAVGSAFVFPDFTTPTRPRIDGLFVPVSAPSAAAARWVRGRFVTDGPADPRPAEQVSLENARLRVELDYLTDQLSALIELNRDRERLGQVRHLCSPVAVEGTDSSGLRETLSIRGGVEGLRPGLAVLYPQGVVGQVEGVGIAGFRVRLLTDPGFRVMGRFRRIERDGDGPDRSELLQLPPAVVEGVGRNTLVIRTLARADINGVLRIGDTVTLADNTWDEAVQGYRLGRVVAIGTLPDAPLTAEIRVEPEAALLRLRDVLVMNRPQPVIDVNAPKG